MTVVSASHNVPRDNFAIQRVEEDVAAIVALLSEPKHVSIRKRGLVAIFFLSVGKTYNFRPPKDGDMLASLLRLFPWAILLMPVYWRKGICDFQLRGFFMTINALVCVVYAEHVIVNLLGFMTAARQVREVKNGYPVLGRGGETLVTVC